MFVKRSTKINSLKKATLILLTGIKKLFNDYGYLQLYKVDYHSQLDMVAMIIKIPELGCKILLFLVT